MLRVVEALWRVGVAAVQSEAGVEAVLREIAGRAHPEVCRQLNNNCKINAVISYGRRRKCTWMCHGCVEASKKRILGSAEMFVGCWVTSPSMTNTRWLKPELDGSPCIPV
jgi:hypothetical protein